MLVTLARSVLGQGCMFWDFVWTLHLKINEIDIKSITIKERNYKIHSYLCTSVCP